MSCAGERGFYPFDIAEAAIVDPLGAADLFGLGKLDLAFERRLDLGLRLVRELEAVGTEELDTVVVVGVVGSGDHHAHIRAHGFRQHPHGRRRHRAEEEDVHARGGEPGSERVFEHVA